MALPDGWDTERFKKFSTDTEWLVLTTRYGLELHLSDPVGWPLDWLISELHKRKDFESGLKSNYRILEEWIIVESNQGFSEVARFGEEVSETAHGLALIVAGIHRSRLLGTASRVRSNQGTQIDPREYSVRESDPTYSVAVLYTSSVMSMLRRERALLLRSLKDERPVSERKLNGCESAIVQSISESGPMKGELLAQMAGYPFNSNFKSTLARLVTSGILTNSRGSGYDLKVRT